MIWLLDKLHIVRGVYLLDQWGEIRTTWIMNDPFTPQGTLMAWIYPWTKVGRVCLLADGTVKQPSYIKEWRWMSPRGGDSAT